MATAEMHPVQTSGAPKAVPGPVRFHLSINVADLPASVRFYRILFDVEPAKCHDDYAKFELAEPPLVLSLEPQAHAGGGALNHLGFRLREAKELVEIQRRLEAAGVSTSREDGVECCYARQTKFWARDPDRNLWEMYVLEEDVERRGARPPTASAGPTADGAPAPAAAPPEVTWEHHLGEPFPASIPLADSSADRILLRGTFNVPLAPGERARILGQAHRALRGGGRLVIHGLAADAKVESPLQLPGAAAGVRHVPTAAEILASAGDAKFVGLRLQKLSALPVFWHHRVGLREILMEGAKPEDRRFALSQSVIYKGPLAEVTDDLGHTYRRGEPTRVSADAAELLRSGGLAEAFVFVGP